MVGLKKYLKVIFLLVLILPAWIFCGERLQAFAQEPPSFSGPIYVLLYHSWEEGFEPTFRAHLNWLKQKGYQTIPLEALVDYLEKKEVSLPTRPILLTFDDGSIKDYETVYPILKEFGYAGTSFVMTGPTFTLSSNKFWWREVDRSGALRIENHSYSHGLIWISPSIVDFYSGEDSGDYFLIKGMDWRLGTPIYEFGYELVNGQYFPDQGIANLCVNHVAQNGGEEFFKKEGWREELRQVVEDYRNRYSDSGRYEGETQKGMRFKKEIYWSMKIIEMNIGSGKEVKYFAYPWGVYDDPLILQLKNDGYLGAFTTSEFEGNYPGDDPFQIRRVIITSDMMVETLAAILGAD